MQVEEPGVFAWPGLGRREVEGMRPAKQKQLWKNNVGSDLNPEEELVFSLQPVSLGRSVDITRAHSMWNTE